MVLTGEAAFLKKGEQLKNETEEKKLQEDKALSNAKSSLELIKQNKDLGELYKGSAGMGTQNLAGSLPMLKVHAAGRSSSNQLANGTEPQDGSFFYKPTQEEFKELDVHVLTISKGYRTDGMQGKTNVFHQVLAGVVTNNGGMKPFIMFFTGIKLRTLWDFGKDAGTYTKNKSMPLPLFALSVKMTTEKQKTDYGYSWIVKFEINKDKNGAPILVTDSARFKQLRLAVEKAEDMIQSLIETKSSGPEEPVVTDMKPETEGVKEREVRAEDIPF